MNCVYHADCMDVFPLIEDGSVDMVLVDLPYGQTACNWDCLIDLDAMWIHLKRICKPSANIIFFCTTRFGNALINSNYKYFRYDLVWSKPSSNAGYLSANRMPLRKHELIYVFGWAAGGKKTYNAQKTPGEPFDYGGREPQHDTIYAYRKKWKCVPNVTGDRHPGSIITRELTGEKRVHLTQKPLGLCEWLIKSYSNEGDVILDFTMGSGSTIVAAKNTKRRYIGVEKDAGIFEVAMNRLREVVPDGV